MHTPIPVIVGHAAQPAHVSQVTAAVTALIVAAVIILVFKVAGRLLDKAKPKKARTSLPYSARGR